MWAFLALACLVFGVAEALKVNVDTRRERPRAAEAVHWPSFTEKNDSTGRMRYIHEKVKIDHSGISNAPDLDDALAKAKSKKVSGQTPKVAFLFLLMDAEGGLDWPKIWDAFFADAPSDHFSIYLHIARPNESAPTPLNEFGAVVVPRVPNDWCALMGAEVSLITAALEDPSNAQFVLVSHDTVPLKTFSYVHSNLAVDSPETSKLCFAERAHANLIVEEAAVDELGRKCFFRDFYSRVNPRTPKHHQWFVLARKHAIAVAKNARNALDVWTGVWEVAVPDIANMGEGCSDEVIPGASLLLDAEMRNANTTNVWHDFATIGVEQKCLTLVHWHNCFRGTQLELPPGEEFTLVEDLEFVYRHLGEVMKFLKPSDYDWVKSSIKTQVNEFPHMFVNTSLPYLRRVVQHGFMFARKFPPDLRLVDEDGSTVSFLDVLPKLWTNVNESAARERVWSRNSFAGRPDSN
eukprot:CAMPEP_0117474202 /NCGR_PEP_ID=MMETSP0784-20121206/9164_1 /TAXON_ID=39447 /ORGANISM="" /LENGTH=462 /DNA_ID=CAMNT_0005268423 /DNA_START=63 /DNA_END=1451 /DNA_ORIENTATION=+